MIAASLEVNYALIMPRFSIRDKGMPGEEIFSRTSYLPP